MFIPPYDCNLNSKNRIQKNLAKRRFFHTMRKKLRAKLCKNGEVAPNIMRKYKLGGYSKFKKIAKYRNYIFPTYEIVIPDVFSFIEAPKSTLSFFRKLRKKLNRKEPYRLYIIHTNCKTIDLAASFYFDQIIKEEQRYWKRFRVTIQLSGEISKISRCVNNFLLSFGLLSKINILQSNFSEKQIDYDYKKKYYTFIVNGNKKENYKKSQASYGLVEYFDNCFKHNNLQIVQETKLDLAHKIGEIVGNAEEHSGDQVGKWYALGCYNKDEKECSFAIINFGYSIYETLSNQKSTAADVIEKVTDIIEGNRSAIERLGMHFDRFHEEPLWSIMALQDGISSKRTSTGIGRTHGHGIMDVLSFIGNVRSEQSGAKVCIISGHSAIMVDYTYPIITKEVGENKEKRRMLIFNKEQNLKLPPDVNKVFSVTDKFPGTIFAGRFKIDKKYLIQKMESK